MGKTEIEKRVNDDSIHELLSQIKLKSYIGKTVGELLKNDTLKYYKEYLWFDEPPGKLNSLCLNYSKNVFLEIHSKPLKFTPSFSETRTFNFELYKKEKITKIVVNDNSTENIIK